MILFRNKTAMEKLISKAHLLCFTAVVCVVVGAGLPATCPGQQPERILEQRDDARMESKPSRPPTPAASPATSSKLAPTPVVPPPSHKISKRVSVDRTALDELTASIKTLTRQVELLTSKIEELNKKRGGE